MKIRTMEVNNIKYQFAAGAMWTSIKMAPDKQQHGAVPETHRVETMIRTPAEARDLEGAVQKAIKERVNAQLKAAKEATTNA